MDPTTFTPIGPNPVFQDASEAPSLAQMEPSFAEYFEGQAGNVVRDSPLSAWLRSSELTTAEHGLGKYGRFVGPGQRPEPAKTIPSELAKARAEEAGVKIDFGEGPTTEAAVTIMIDRARRREVRDRTVAAYEPSMGTTLGVSVIASLADPLNVGAAFIPFVGEARYGAWLAQASGFAARSGIRLGVGAGEGLLGAALVEPIIAEAATQEGRDYSLADSLRNLAFGTAFGAGLHVAGGAIAEKVFKRTYAGKPVETPADIIDRLPDNMKEAGLRGAIADLVEGNPVKSAETVDVMARHDANLAEAISYAATLRKDGPPIDDTLARIEYWEQRLSASPPPKPVDFLSWVRQQGGVRDTTGELKEAVVGTSHLGKAFISKAGAAKTERGVEVEQLFEAAKAEGYVTTREEFVDAFKAGGVKRHTAAMEAAVSEFADAAEHNSRMLAEAGANPKTRNAFKARAIVGREQMLVAMERARSDSAISRFYGSRIEPAPIKPEPLQEPGASPLDDLETKSPTAKPNERQSGEVETLKAETMRRFEAITKHLPPETRAKIGDDLARIDAETAELEKIYDSAIACLLGI